MNCARLCRGQWLVIAGGLAVVAAAVCATISAAPLPAGEPAKDSNASTVEYADSVLIQLAVSDLDHSIAFYRDVLDLKLVVHEPGLEWAKFDTAVPGVRIGIGRQDHVAGSGTTSINLGVTDTDAARAVLESRGVTFTGETLNIPGVVKLATFVDPDGNRLRLAGPADAVDETKRQ